MIQNISPASRTQARIKDEPSSPPLSSKTLVFTPLMRFEKQLAKEKPLWRRELELESRSSVHVLVCTGPPACVRASERAKRGKK